MDELDSKEKQKMASKQYREKQKEIQMQQQEVLDRLQLENIKLEAENSLLKQQNNSVFLELHSTIKDLAYEIQKMNQNGAEIVENQQLELDPTIFTDEPYQFNQNSFFVFVLLILLILPSIFIPTQFQYNNIAPKFLDVQAYNHSSETEQKYAGVQLKKFTNVAKSNNTAIQEISRGFQIDKLCERYCEGNIDAE
ncbi:hypothetical protein SS50377_24880 [Spironucleus salmonicida]|uniref:TFIIS central domain-containing protein n=1 Tax=Spironucleus salmonicida TaxID=348837 RepID=V6LF66_9EUKA|nr:hypothetical protein SS50377_24880 [Spironucleus salmonicida]|eukprot:EST43147.1 Hypothetical protein SS50377_17204 [Spironucleus salmonicida]